MEALHLVCLFAGFIPNSMVASSGRPEEGMRVRALFVEVDELQNRLVLSQRMVLQAELLKSLTPGDIVEGKVTWIESYGAFVDIGLQDGRAVPGLIHKSELSWKTVIVPESVISVGEWVKAKVLDVNPGRGRVSLSLREMQPDPLKVNLETMMGADISANADWTEASAPLPGLESVINTLRERDGIEEVRAGRQQAHVPGAVSQDLELWLSRDQIDDHYTVVARANSTLQEIYIYSSLSGDDIKAAIDDALKAAL